VEPGRNASCAQRTACGGWLAAFADWGIPTAESLEAVARCVTPSLDRPGVHLFASGGIRSGQDIAKCAALGADLVGLASPFLKKAVAGAEEVAEEMEILTTELRITMFCSGACDLTALRNHKCLCDKQGDCRAR
jgi:isopentenyl-diphosphate delta-isomerase